MPHLHKKIKGKKPCYYIREMARIGGKPKVVNQIYLGSVERIMNMALGQQKTDLKKIQSQEFGSLFLANQVEKQVKIVDIIDSVVPPGSREKRPSLGEYFLYAIFNRMIQPRSKMGLAQWYKKFAVHQVRPVEIGALTSQRYWEKWDRVDQRSIKESLFYFSEKLKR